MDRTTTVTVSALLHERGTPYLQWVDVPTLTLTGYKLDLALLALWEQVLGRHVATHVKLS
jgi:hypothetical protein